MGRAKSESEMTLRVGVTQRVHDQADRGERRDCLDQAWAPWIAACGGVAVAIPNRLVDPAAFVNDLEFDALVLTGGNDLARLPGAQNTAPERDATETALLAHASEIALPVLAVCRGMQMLVSHWGGTLRRVDGHVGLPHAVQRHRNEWRLRPGPVNSFHDWGVALRSVGPTLTVLATAPDQTVEAVAHPSLPQVGIMWHPERLDPDPVDQQLLGQLLERRR